MDTNIFIMVSDDKSHLEVDGHFDLFARFLSILDTAKVIDYNNSSDTRETKTTHRMDIHTQEVDGECSKKAVSLGKILFAQTKPENCFE